ncbi:uncharacterized protein B0I36DRAFT_146929 [Microdochium trichocladiopsis]|uniref:Uncharacterized protein n=1 Tax=Microdochium trichocladiopsis TaxID=1682393 RepID=A0A9P9BNT9_9PEZI|nr:uncharacterized protein B0I36DRAFT_146929 [Microdochium trichocladiopsis]KAH7028076.1 hypothetical protein B0I36DRAFT_146929 [Microdochium trichocladiopsis]
MASPRYRVKVTEKSTFRASEPSSLPQTRREDTFGPNCYCPALSRLRSGQKPVCSRYRHSHLAGVMLSTVIGSMRGHALSRGQVRNPIARAQRSVTKLRRVLRSRSDKPCGKGRHVVSGCVVHGVTQTNPSTSPLSGPRRDRERAAKSTPQRRRRARAQLCCSPGQPLPASVLVPQKELPEKCIELFLIGQKGHSPCP